jgi:glycosyltransferase involved in cell wall biosynthesis
MRIAIVSTLRPYNESRLYDRQALLWAERGHQVHIIARNLGEPLEELPPGLSVTRLESSLRGWSRRLHLGLQAMRCALMHRPEVIHYHDPELHFWLPRLSRKGVKVVYDVRENHPFLIEHFNRFRLSSASRLFAHVFWKLEGVVLRRAFLVSVTHGISDIYRALGRPIVTVMNFAAKRRFERLDPAREPIMICGGTLNEDRGLTDMVELLARVRVCVPAARLLLVGSFASPKLRSTVQSHARKLGVEAALDLLDRVSHREYVGSILPRARLGVSITPPNAQNDRGFSVRLGEYWAAGLPSVATALPEVSAIHSRDPFFDVFQYGDMDSLQGIAERYLLDYEAAYNAGRLARQRFEEVYNGELEFEKLERFYQSEILQERRIV